MAFKYIALNSLLEKTSYKIYLISAFVVLSTVVAAWQIVLIFNINHLQSEIDVLTKELLESSDVNSQTAKDSPCESQSSNLNPDKSSQSKIGQDNSDITIQDILEGSVNLTDFMNGRHDFTNLATSRVKRDDTDGRREDSGRTSSSDSSCVAPKVLNLELTVYARSVEIDEVRKLDRWAIRRGPPIENRMRLDPRTHIQQDGSIEIQENGIYLIYAQLTFGASRRANRIGFNIQKNSGESLAKCIDQEHGLEAEDGVSPHAARQCYTSTVAYLKQNDKLSILTTYPDQSIYPNRDMSFWGFVKLSC